METSDTNLIPLVHLNVRQIWFSYATQDRIMIDGHLKQKRRNLISQFDDSIEGSPSQWYLLSYRNFENIVNNLFNFPRFPFHKNAWFIKSILTKRVIFIHITVICYMNGTLLCFSPCVLWYRVTIKVRYNIQLIHSHSPDSCTALSQKLFRFFSSHSTFSYT